ncbi:MAG: OmpH family outer membrane protein [Pseudomonadota bacterium]
MRGRSVTVICLVLGMALIWLGTGEAQGLKIGFVDFGQFAKKSKRAQAQETKLVQLVSKKRDEFEKKKKELMDLQEKLQKTGPMLKEEARNAMIKELGIKEMELKLLEKEAENAVRNEQRSTQEVFQQDVIKVIGAIRAQKGLNLVVNYAALLAADDALNITDEVVQAYDAQVPSTPKPAAAAPRKPAPRAAPAPAAPARAPK